MPLLLVFKSFMNNCVRYSWNDYELLIYICIIEEDVLAMFLGFVEKFRGIPISFGLED